MSNFSISHVSCSVLQVPCQNCGCMINWRYVITSQDGSMTVGSECARTLCGPAIADAMKRRAQRASRQWHDQKPAPRTGESRDVYIERRLAEMGNALAAHKAWILFERAGNGSNWLRHMYALNGRARHLFRIPPAVFNGIRFAPGPHEPFPYPRVKDHMLAVFERRFNASRWDFDRASWDVVKI